MTGRLWDPTQVPASPMPAASLTPNAFLATFPLGLRPILKSSSLSARAREVVVWGSDCLGDAQLTSHRQVMKKGRRVISGRGWEEFQQLSQFFSTGSGSVPREGSVPSVMMEW